VAGSGECGDEPSDSGAMELVNLYLYQSSMSYDLN
jgi:hypothetical protein